MGKGATVGREAALPGGSDGPEGGLWRSVAWWYAVRMAFGHRRLRRRGFTLVELLVVVAIVALLIGLLLPALRRARDAGRAAACLSNERQIGIAWGAYLADFDKFPWGSEEHYERKARSGWGGVHWYGWDGGQAHEEAQFLAAARPVNPYLGEDLVAEAVARIFRCPSDSGVGIYGHPEQEIWWKDFGAGNRSGEGDETVFGMLGNSYGANMFMYTRWVNRQPVTGPWWGPSRVTVSPSRFVVAGDLGSMVIAGNGAPFEYAVYGWWHGEGRGQLLFLDGSARAGSVVSDEMDFTMRMDP